MHIEANVLSPTLDDRNDETSPFAYSPKVRKFDFNLLSERSQETSHMKIKKVEFENQTGRPSSNPKEVEDNPKKQCTEPQPPYLAEFDVLNDSFKFGAIGLYNTPRDLCFYKIKAKFCNLEWTFNDPEWEQTTTAIYRFKE